MSDGPTTPPGKKSDGGIPWKTVAWAALAVYAVIFVLVNDKKAEINFVLFTINTRLLWLILLSMALGAGLALVVPRWWRSRRQR